LKEKTEKNRLASGFPLLLLPLADWPVVSLSNQRLGGPTRKKKTRSPVARTAG
jgi:hypothetical protein